MNNPRLEFTAGTKSIAGDRPYQEDASRVWRPASSTGNDAPILAVLADGMGGHVSGELASRLAAEQYINAFSSEHGSIDQRLEHALHAGNDAISSAIRKEKGLDGMGSTLVAGYIDQEGLRWVSVGDSMLLLFRNRELRRLNESHSLGALLDKHANAKVISQEEAKNSPSRHTLRSALTGAPIPLKDINCQPLPLLSGDWIVLASDGLETLDGDTIAEVISRHEQGQADQIAKALVDRVTSEKQPNQDNTTVVVIRVQDPTHVPTRIVMRVPDTAVTVPADMTEPTTIPLSELGGPPPADHPLPAARMRTKLAIAATAVTLVAIAWLIFGVGGSDQANPPTVAATTGDHKPEKKANQGEETVDRRPKPAEKAEKESTSLDKKPHAASSQVAPSTPKAPRTRLRPWSYTRGAAKPNLTTGPPETEARSGGKGGQTSNAAAGATGLDCTKTDSRRPLACPNAFPAKD